MPIMMVLRVHPQGLLVRVQDWRGGKAEMVAFHKEKGRVGEVAVCTRHTITCNSAGTLPTSSGPMTRFQTQGYRLHIGPWLELEDDDQ